MPDPQADVIAFLAAPSTHGGQEVEHISTHGAHVFLAGDKAYKLKRAVRYSFMDFSTIEKRRRALIREYELNQPHAPEIYQAVKPIRRAGAQLSFDSNGPIIDWVLVMTR